MLIMWIRGGLRKQGDARWLFNPKTPKCVLHVCVCVCVPCGGIDTNLYLYWLPRKEREKKSLCVWGFHREIEERKKRKTKKKEREMEKKRIQGGRLVCILSSTIEARLIMYHVILYGFLACLCFCIAMNWGRKMEKEKSEGFHGKNPIH